MTHVLAAAPLGGSILGILYVDVRGEVLVETL